MSTETVEASRVALGVQLLDRYVPGWVQNVDRHRLDMSSSSLCVVGQQPGGYWVNLVTLGLDPEYHWYQVEAAGFVASSRDEYRALDVEWQRVIAERQGRQPKPRRPWWRRFFRREDRCLSR